MLSVVLCTIQIISHSEFVRYYKAFCESATHPIPSGFQPEPRRKTVTNWMIFVILPRLPQRYRPHHPPAKPLGDQRQPVPPGGGGGGATPCPDCGDKRAHHRTTNTHPASFFNTTNNPLALAVHSIRYPCPQTASELNQITIRLKRWSINEDVTDIEYLCRFRDTISVLPVMRTITLMIQILPMNLIASNNPLVI